MGKLKKKTAQPMPWLVFALLRPGTLRNQAELERALVAAGWSRDQARHDSIQGGMPCKN